MTIQWVLIATFLYFELGLAAILSLPFISPKIWKCLLHLHTWRTLVMQMYMYFNVFLVVLVLFLLDSIREMIKYSGIYRHDYEAELQTHMKLFRSQRNYYIVGFAIFLSLVIKRICNMILIEAELMVKDEEALGMAQEATENLEKLRKQSQTHKEDHSTKETEIQHRKEIEELQNLLNTKNNELSHNRQLIEDLKDKNDKVVADYNQLKDKVELLKKSVPTSSD